MFRLRQFAVPVLGLAMAAGLSACGPDRNLPENIPDGSMILEMGKKHLTARASHSGEIYVYDASAKKVVYSGPVKAGDNIRVDTALKDQVMINGKVVAQPELDDSHKYTIYFTERPEPMVEREREVIRESDATSANGTVVREKEQEIRRGDDRTIIREKEIQRNP